MRAMKRALEHNMDTKELINEVGRLGRVMVTIQGEMPVGTAAAQQRKTRAFEVAGALLRLHEEAKAEAIATFRSGVIKQLSPRARKHIESAIADASETCLKWTASAAGARPGHVSWDLGDMERMLKADKTVKHLAGCLKGIDKADLPDFGLAEAIEEMAQELRRWSPCHSTSLMARMEAECEYEALRDNYSGGIPGTLRMAMVLHEDEVSKGWTPALPPMLTLAAAADAAPAPIDLTQSSEGGPGDPAIKTS